MFYVTIVTSMDEYKVKTAVFEGPLEALLGMIEKRKLFIGDIALSQVADDYITYVQSIQNEKGYPMAEVAQFILIASTLLLYEIITKFHKVDAFASEPSKTALKRPSF